MRTAVFALAIASVLMISSARSARADEVVPAPTEEVAQARAQIDATVDQMRAIAVRVRDELRTARKRGTRAQIACANQSLSRADVAVRRARETGDEALALYAKGEVERARAARRRLAELREAQRLAAAESTSCAPPVVVATSGVTTVQMQVDAQVPAAQQ